MNDRYFLFKVVMFSTNEEIKSPSHYRQSYFTLKVPYRRMKQEIQRITRLGGKILNITPYDLSSTLPWWIEIETREPNCLYYFGPFDELDEARSYESGYIEDLQQEGAQGIRVQLKQCHPSILTEER
ncbi:DUF1816 domain-containing protein [Chroococcus sp. FPU101]|uniref:DUF1816 domain-containing protein n=1 Tax=Chroococcus sp. FPU101 TaxID=1974212 RepID=UPI002413E0BB|nr:DUF1816 domain-containing protein [Chroococcus sp. FPU101]